MALINIFFWAILILASVLYATIIHGLEKAEKAADDACSRLYSQTHALPDHAGRRHSRQRSENCRRGRVGLPVTLTAAPDHSVCRNGPVIHVYRKTYISSVRDESDHIVPDNNGYMSGSAVKATPDHFRSAV